MANSMVIFNGIRRRKIIKHYSNYFVLSMAFADFSVIFFTIPLMYVEYLVGFKWMSVYICQYVFQIREAFQGAAIFSISTLAILRLRQVFKHPLQQFSRRTCTLLVVAIWIVSFLVCSVPLMDVYTILPSGTCDPVWPKTRGKIHMSFICAIVISPMVIATIAYGIVIFKISNTLFSDSDSERQVKRNRSITVLLVMLIGSCWISYTPLSIYILLKLYTNVNVAVPTWHIVALLYIGGSALNPVLVLLTMPKDYRFNVECKRKQRVGVCCPKEPEKADLQSTNVELQDQNIIER